MKVINKDFKKGFVKLMVESNDDLWTLYKLLREGDLLSGKTVRKIVKGDKSEGERKPVFIKVEVKKVEFQESQFVLRALGRVIEGPEDVPRSVHHSFAIKPGVGLNIERSDWSAYDKELIRKAAEPSKGEVLIITLDNEEAYYALLTKDKVAGVNTQKSGLPRKDSPDYESILESYYKSIVKNTKALLKAKGASKVIIACVGFVYDELRELFNNESDIKNKIFFARVSVTGISGVNELIREGVIDKVRSEDLITRETALVEEFLSGLAKQKLVKYGFKDVAEAVKLGAGRVLLISERLIIDFRARNRFKELEELLDNAEKLGTKVEFISDKHEAGERLYKLGGTALLLRYEV